MANKKSNLYNPIVNEGDVVIVSLFDKNSKRFLKSAGTVKLVLGKLALLKEEEFRGYRFDCETGKSFTDNKSFFEPATQDDLDNMKNDYRNELITQVDAFITFWDATGVSTNDLQLLSDLFISIDQKRVV